MLNYSFSVTNVFWFVLINLVFSRGLFLLFPEYVSKRFSPTPKLIPYTALSNSALLIFSVFTIVLPAHNSFLILATGIIIFILGLILTISGIFFFAINEPDRMVKTGVYKYFRHPVYFGNYIQLAGITIYSFSFELALFAILHIIFHHFIIVQEEKDLIKFYTDYRPYKQNTRRFFFSDY